MIPHPRVSRVKGIINVTRYRLGFAASAGRVIRHGFGNITRQLFQRPVSMQGIIIFAFHTLALSTVAFRALLAEKLTTSLRLLGCKQSLLAAKKKQRQRNGALLHGADEHHG